jgi:ribonuclease VapC
LILDTSAVISVIREERGCDRLVEVIEGAAEVGMGAPTLTEASMVLVGRFGLVGRLALSRFLEDNKVIPIAFDERHWSVAAEAFIRYGKGRHPAALNYGDCMTYATASVVGHSLLFTGDDFAQTDLVSALA